MQTSLQSPRRLQNARVAGFVTAEQQKETALKRAHGQCSAERRVRLARYNGDLLMMGTQAAPERLFYDFCLEDHVPDDHLLRCIDRFLDLGDVRQTLKPFYCTIGRPSIDPE